MSENSRNGRGGAPEAEMWGRLVVDSLVRPRRAAQRVLDLSIGWDAVLQVAVAVTCIGVVMGFAAMRLSGGAIDPLSAAVLRTPLIGALAQFAMMGVIALLTFRIGRMFNGGGALWGAAVLVVWLNAMTLLIQVVQLVLLVMAPPLGGLLALATLFWLVWAYANFVTELHGFQSPVMVLGVTVLSVIAIMLGLTMIAAILGYSPPGGA